MHLKAQDFLNHQQISPKEKVPYQTQEKKNHKIFTNSQLTFNTIQIQESIIAQRKVNKETTNFGNSSEDQSVKYIKISYNNPRIIIIIIKNKTYTLLYMFHWSNGCDLGYWVELERVAGSERKREHRVKDSGFASRL